MNQKISASRSQLQGLLDEFCNQQGDMLTRLAQQVASLFAGGGQLLLAGNAAFQPVVQLLAGHFTYRLGFDRPALPAIAIGSDPVLAALMVSSGEADQHLVRHYRSLTGGKQLLLLFSDGGNSPALQILRDEVLENEQLVALVSATGAADALCRDGIETCLALPTGSRPRQLELALFAGQLLCELVESELFGV
ncbi:D-sedoheptulose 7-phosphate isomerase [Malonomonas rubra DSM 5091]|uniref:D-sedoheptulose 7-phosphate isomerase n=1 Tax=Malonomonas rubra DSM 5091 TaxID=1122189 RepID=A0A1M6FG01_MALRU|nr:SIS domain-containing protein [Malonomonas rubra]SHI96576.1 D-sedoheptulose 7-phosphate isomerase [Malonomonas rubra DSM 5091]